MTTWILSTQHKKNAVEKQFWYKDGKVIVKEEGYRWGTFYVETDTMPDVSLTNEDGYELCGLDDGSCWELETLDDGCWTDWSFPDGMPEEEQEAIQKVWEEDYFEGMEGLGWSNDDTEYWMYGPLQLENKDTGQVFDSNNPSTDTVDEVEESLEDDAIPHDPTKWPFAGGN